MGMVAAVSGPSSPPDAKTVATSWDDVRDLSSRSFPKVGQLMDDAKAEVLAFTAPGYAGQRARHLPRQNRSNWLKVYRPGTVATSQSPAVCWRLHSMLE